MPPAFTFEIKGLVVGILPQLLLKEIKSCHEFCVNLESLSKIVIWLDCDPHVLQAPSFPTITNDAIKFVTITCNLIFISCWDM